MLGHEVAKRAAGHEELRARRSEDVANGVAIRLHLGERGRRIHRHGDDASRQAGHESEDELVGLGKDERDPITLRETEGIERLRAAACLFPKVGKAHTPLVAARSKKRDGTVAMDCVLAKYLRECSHRLLVRSTLSAWSHKRILGQDQEKSFSIRNYKHLASFRIDPTRN